MGAVSEPDAGPDSPHVPKLPAGWIAQWDSSSRKYYYVQISTGKSTWELPTTIAPGVVTASASSTPAQASPYAPPPLNDMPGEPENGGTRGDAEHGEQSDRGLGTMALSMLTQGSGGGKPPNNNLIGQLASSVLGGSKPQGSSGNSMGGQQQGGQGLGGLIGGFIPHSQPPQQSNFGYSTTGQSGAYDGQEPPATYKPPNANPAGQYGGTPPSTSQQLPGQTGQFQSQQAPYGQPGVSSQGFPSYPTQSQPAYGQPPSQYPNTYGQPPSQLPGYGQGQVPSNGPPNQYSPPNQPFGQPQQGQYGSSQPAQGQYGSSQPAQGQYGSSQPAQGQYGSSQPPQAQYGAGQGQYGSAQPAQQQYGVNQPPPAQYNSGAPSQVQYGQPPSAGYPPAQGQYPPPPSHQTAPGGYGQSPSSGYPSQQYQNQQSQYQQQGQGGNSGQGYYQQPGW